MGPDKETCKQCYFFEKGLISKEIGYCRRYPPMTPPDTFGGNNIYPMDSEAWTPPVVETNYWCGEFKKKK